jgi:MerR-like DNA binding protein
VSIEEEWYYPGSQTPRKTVTAVPEEEKEPGLLDEAVEALGEPVVFSVNGIDVEFFLIGQLAAALGRSATTLRRWESQGIIPRSGYTKPSKDPRGRRRLYSKEQCRGIIYIYIDEGVWETGRIKGTQFSARVLNLFKELKR